MLATTVSKEDGVGEEGEGSSRDELSVWPVVSTGVEFGFGVCQFVCEVWMGPQLEDDSGRAGTAPALQKALMDAQCRTEPWPFLL